MTETETKFTPSAAARAAFKAMADEGHDAIMERFFGIWEADGDPRRAGSMAAHAFITNAARIAVFGALCGGHEPQQELWQACCEEAFHQAVKDVATAFDKAEPLNLAMGDQERQT